MSAARPVIVLRDVVKVYDQGRVRVAAVKGVSLTIEEGDFVAVMGASGSGKSTLMNILGCLDVPTSGRYLLDGVDVATLGELDLAHVRNRQIGFVLQSFSLVARTSALSNVELPLVYAGVRRKERRRRALQALADVGLTTIAPHYPNEMSGGQQQRVTIARAIVTNPAMILADEPTGNLDSVSTAAVMNIFSHLSAEGRTVVLITHEDDVARYAKRLIRVRDGSIVEDSRQVAVEDLPPLYVVETENERRAVAAGRFRAAGIIS